MDKLIEFLKPIVVKTIKYFITILLTALGFSTLESCAYVKDNTIENAYFSPPSVRIVDSSFVAPNIDMRPCDSVICSYDDEAASIILDATNFLKILSNKFLSK